MNALRHATGFASMALATLGVDNALASLKILLRPEGRGVTNSRCAVSTRFYIQTTQKITPGNTVPAMVQVQPHLHANASQRCVPLDC